MLRNLLLCLATVAAALTWPAFARADFAACATEGYLAQFDDRITAHEPCPLIGTSTIDWVTDRATVSIIAEPHASVTDDGPIVADVDDVAHRIGPEMLAMGVPRIANVVVLLTDRASPDGQPVADAITRGIGECHVTIYKRERVARTPDFTRFLIAHELFHCIQNSNWSDRNRNDEARWWLEGTAELFANIIYPGKTYTEDYFAGFESQRQNSLTSMLYPSVMFFFWYVQEHAISSIPAFIAGMAPADAPGQNAQNRYLADIVDVDAWMEFAEAYLDDHVVWPDGRAISIAPSLGSAVTISASRTLDFPTVPFAIRAVPLTFTTRRAYDIDRNLPSTMRVHWSESGPWSDPPSTVVACDSDRHFRQVIGAVEGTPTLHLEITARPVEDSDCCPGGRAHGDFALGYTDECPDDGGYDPGADTGEPHLVTFDGYEYSFQAAGEFVLTRTRDGFEIQTRQEALKGMDVSVNTAAAIRIGGHRVAFYAHAFDGVPISTSRAYVDGAPKRIGESGITVGNATIKARGDNAYDVMLANGGLIHIDFFDWDGVGYLDLMLEMRRSTAGSYTGLLGDMDGNAENDLRIQGGGLVSANRSTYDRVAAVAGGALPIPVPIDAAANAYYEQLYRSFGNSWRVTDAASMFNYGAGQSTATFTRRDFPSRFLSLSSIDQRAVADAQAACEAAKVAPQTMNGCIYDVAVTGNKGFASDLGRLAAQRLKERAEDELRRRVPGLPGVPSLPSIPLP